MTTRTYTPPNRKEEARLAKEVKELSQDAVSDFAKRVLHRLNAVPRYQSIGRNKYVFIEDVAQLMDEELNGGRE